MDGVWGVEIYAGGSGVFEERHKSFFGLEEQGIVVESDILYASCSEDVEFSNYIG